MVMTLLIACLLLGCVTGLRSLTAPAVVCWGAHFGWLHFAGTKLAFLDRRATLIVFTVLAIGELIADKLPRAPARTAPLGLIVRIAFGGLCGWALATSTAGNPSVAANVGVLGALIGTFGGYNIRKALVTRVHIPDLAVAIVEDFIAIGSGLLIVSRL